MKGFSTPKASVRQGLSQPVIRVLPVAEGIEDPVRNQQFARLLVIIVTPAWRPLPVDEAGLVWVVPALDRAFVCASRAIGRATQILAGYDAGVLVQRFSRSAASTFEPPLRANVRGLRRFWTL
jgi:hypothetical protein